MKHEDTDRCEKCIARQDAYRMLQKSIRRVGGGFVLLEKNLVSEKGLFVQIEIEYELICYVEHELTACVVRESTYLSAFLHIRTLLLLHEHIK